MADKYGGSTLVRPVNLVLVVFLIVQLLIAVTPSLIAGASEESPNDELRRYVVGFHVTPSDLELGGEYVGARIQEALINLNAIVVDPPEQTEWEEYALQDDRVRYVEKVGETRAAFTPNDPDFNNLQYGPQLIRAPEAWDVNQGSTAVEVCIVDTGVFPDHPDLALSRYIPEKSKSFILGNPDPTDNNGHGTRVAGIALATINNAVGIAGLAQVSYYTAKVLRHDMGGGSVDLANGIIWCADQGADIINISIVENTFTQIVADAVSYAWQAGSLLVGAAGNDGGPPIRYPARHPEVIAVTCVDSNKNRCLFSNTGPEAELAAPGLDIWSTTITCFIVNGDRFCNPDYAMDFGTSFSAPHVTGVAALVKSANPSKTNQEIRDHLNATAEDRGDPLRDDEYGWGLVDAYEAYFREASLGGVVWDRDTGLPISGVLVEVQGSQTNTNGNGHYEFPELVEGTYTVKFTHFGYDTEQRIVTLQPGSNQLNLSMKSKSGGSPFGPIRDFP